VPRRRFTASSILRFCWTYCAFERPTGESLPSVKLEMVSGVALLSTSPLKWSSSLGRGDWKGNGIVCDKDTGQKRRQPLIYAAPYYSAGFHALFPEYDSIWAIDWGRGEECGDGHVRTIDRFEGREVSHDTHHDGALRGTRTRCTRRTTTLYYTNDDGGSSSNPPKSASLCIVFLSGPGAVNTATVEGFDLLPLFQEP
jgi:hypothetical protein